MVVHKLREHTNIQSAIWKLKLNLRNAEIRFMDVYQD